MRDPFELVDVLGDRVFVGLDDATWPSAETAVRMISLLLTLTCGRSGWRHSMACAFQRAIWTRARVRRWHSSITLAWH